MRDTSSVNKIPKPAGCTSSASKSKFHQQRVFENLESKYQSSKTFELTTGFTDWPRPTQIDHLSAWAAAQVIQPRLEIAECTSARPQLSGQDEIRNLGDSPQARALVAKVGYVGVCDATVLSCGIGPFCCRNAA